MKINITMELLSDTIFGSGYSIPGGEDIAVCVDSNGYPYLKGSTFKGLLREAAENYLAWTKGDPAQLPILFGESGFSGVSGERRIFLTDFRLEDMPDDPTECFSQRTFTKLENGVVAGGTLRTAACVCRGQLFTGSIFCASEDAGLLQNALSCIQWLGTSRSRGFGAVKITSEAIAETNDSEKDRHLTRAWLPFVIRTELPVLMVDHANSFENHVQTLDYLTGSSIRGAVLSKLAQEDPEWFQENRTALLQVTFLDALPADENNPVFPTPMGFYANKDGSDFTSVLYNGFLKPGLKRAKIGFYCTLRPSGNQLELHEVSVKTGGSVRIQRGTNKEMFQTRYILPNQQFSGWLYCVDSALESRIAAVLQRGLWLGADRYAGFGKCAVELGKAQDICPYACKGSSEILYMMAVSPFTMRDDNGAVCGLNLPALAAALEIESVEVLLSAASVSKFSTFNRTLGCRSEELRMYQRGSMFKLRCSNAPSLNAIHALEQRGLGIHRAEGFGRVHFLSEAEYLRITWNSEDENSRFAQSEESKQRQERLLWIMDHNHNCAGISQSQLGTIQTLVEEAARQNDMTPVATHLQHNMEERKDMRPKYEGISNFIDQVTDLENDDIIGDTLYNRLILLRDLFDYSRKVEKK